MNAFPPEHLVAERLTLRLPRMSDAKSIYRSYTTDPSVSRYMLWHPHADIHETRLFLASCIHSWHVGEGERPWMIVRQSDESVLGMLGATVEGHMVELGYVLSAGCWGEGFATEAVRAVSDAALDDPSIFRLSATVAPQNQASARVLEKSGFALEATLSRYHIFPNLGPEPRDTLLYARTRP